MSTNGNGRKPEIPAIPQLTAEHECPTCHTKIACDYEAIVQMRDHATRIKLIAAKWEERLRGTLGKSKRANQEWTTEEARDLLMTGMSYRAVGRMLHAKGDTIKQAVTGRR